MMSTPLEFNVPRLLLTSSGLTTHELKQAFVRMLGAASSPSAETRRIAMIVTAQLAPSVKELGEEQPGAVSRRSPGG